MAGVAQAVTARGGVATQMAAARRVGGRRVSNVGMSNGLRVSPVHLHDLLASRPPLPLPATVRYGLRYPLPAC